MAIFFYKDVEHSRKLFEELLKVYDIYRTRDFEVVLVYLYFTEVTPEMEKKVRFEDVFQRSPWLVLPFKDPRVRKLWRIFLSPYEPGDVCYKTRPVADLIIIGPEGRYFERHGADILKKYGIKAYPYTAERATEIEVEELQKLRLRSVLGIPEHLIRGSDNSKVKFSN